MVGGPACEWVLKDRSAVGGLAVIMGGCVGCGGSVGGGGCCCCWFFFFFSKVLLVDVGLCRWWLSTLLQLSWLCRCCY